MQKKSAAKDPAAVALGRKGGKASRMYLSDEEKRELAQRAANARWEKQRKKARGKSSL